eukprot:1161915-Pelagomonas_calceolata.AAC.11
MELQIYHRNPGSKPRRLASFGCKPDERVVSVHDKKSVPHAHGCGLWGLWRQTCSKPFQTLGK